jgi:hypothetical protein
VELTQELPPIISDAAKQLFADDIYFVPIRHHSPACAFALRQLLAEIKPVVVLIEAPDTFQELIPLLLHPDTKPPVAILAQTRESKKSPVSEDDETGEAIQPEIQSAFFPLCDYSPEWIALRDGHALGAQLAFIDLPWKEKKLQHDEVDHEAVENLQSERYLAHSRWLQLLARNSGCRDHHELWDRFFEQASCEELRDWKTIFTHIFYWCAMARQDYEQEVLEAELSLPRERYMASWIKEWRNKITGPMVVVTGGFHTLELLNWKNAAKPSAKKNDDQQWLIRYGFVQLDALNYYAAGMPSPAYYQGLWDGLITQTENHWQKTTQYFLQSLVEKTRKDGLSDALSTADLYAANNQAMGLAYLRGHKGPGRSDLIDAVTSCFMKRESDDGYHGLITDLRTLMCGSRLGDIPASAGSPPLVEDARRQAKVLGIKLDDSEQRKAHLDLYRKKNHRARSRYFQLLNYLQIPFAYWENGPDFLAGSRLDILFEDWRYAWSPSVEARLIELSTQGVSLQAIALRKLAQEESILAQQGQARNAARATQLVIRACLIGLHQRLPALFALVEMHLHEDAVFSSVVNSGHQLLTLLQAREPLGLEADAGVLLLLQKVWFAALYLMPGLSGCKPEDEADCIRDLTALRDFTKRVTKIATAKNIVVDDALMHERLRELANDPSSAASIKACAAALLYLDNQWQGTDLASMLAGQFASGADVETASGFLYGLMRTAPELLLCEAALLQQINQLVTQWSDEDFIAFLPDLRQAFTYLQPQETDQLAQIICDINGLRETIFEYHQSVSELDLQQGLNLHLLMEKALEDDGLIHWSNKKREDIHE